MRIHSRHLVRLAPAFLFLCVLVFGLSGTASAQSFWFEDYERATRLIERGRTEEALDLLREVIAERPMPVALYRAPGNRVIAYLPYYQRARVQFEMGELDRAAHSLRVSEAFGAVLRHRRSREGLTELRGQIETRQVPAVSTNRNY